jgi:hypothetical protein
MLMLSTVTCRHDTAVHQGGAGGSSSSSSTQHQQVLMTTICTATACWLPQDRCCAFMCVEAVTPTHSDCQGSGSVAVLNTADVAVVVSLAPGHQQGGNPGHG